MKRQDLLKAYSNIELIIDNLIKRYDIQYLEANDAPSTFKSMSAHYIEHGVFKVFNGGDHGYLGKEYNIKFRALHDFMHYYNGLTFSFKDEKELSRLTVKLFNKVGISIGLSYMDCYHISKVIDAEIRGQIEYYEQNKTYVPNQSEFISKYLKVSA